MKFLRRSQPAPQPTPHMVLEGDTPLEVVGESFYAESFQRLAQHYRTDGDFPIVADLQAEPDNPHDPNAVAVTVNGLKVGHLNREIAAKYQPAIIRLTNEYGMPVALRGHIYAGHSKGIYSVALNHEPHDFTVSPDSTR